MIALATTGFPSRSLIVAAFLLAGEPALPGNHLQAQASEISVRQSGADTLHIGGGGRGSVPFVIRNHGAAPRPVRLSVGLPDGWRGLAPLPDLILPPDSQVVRIIGFFVPEHASAGIHVIRVGVAGAADSVFVHVSERPRLNVLVDEAPDWVSAGSSYDVRFRVVNTGNVALAVRPSLESAGDLTVRADTTARVLDPGAYFLVEAEVGTHDDVPVAFTHRLLLRAVSPEAMAHAASRVEVMPLGRERPQTLAAGIPARLRLRLSADPRAGAPVRLHARGPVRPGSTTQVDVLLQGPTQGYSVFGEADVYRISIESPSYTLRVGDHVYGLSPLTEPARDGIGAEVRGRTGPFEAGGYVQRSRRGFHAGSQAAANARVHFGSPLVVGMNWLRDTGHGQQREVLSVQTSLHVREGLGLDAEYGVRPATDADAYSVHVRAGIRPLSVNVRRIRGDTAYAGVYGGVQLDAAHVMVHPGSAIFLDGSLEEQRLEHRMFEHTEALLHVRSSSTRRLALRFGPWFAVEGRHDVRSSTLRGGAFHRESQTARVRLGIPIRRVMLYPSVELGWDISADSTDEPTLWKLGLKTHALIPFGTMAGAVEYANAASLHGPGEEAVVSASLSTSLDLGSFGRIQFGGQGTRWIGPEDERSSMLAHGSIERQFTNGHQIAVRVRSWVLTGAFEQRETVALLDYAIPFGLPTPGAKAVRRGTISGRVYDIQSGRPVARAVVILGDRSVVTDARGHVEFTGLEPGTYALRIDRASTGLDQVSTVPLPLMLAVQAGARITLELPLIPAAELSARVEIARATGLRMSADPAAAHEREPLRGVLLEFRRDEERIRRTTDDRGMITVTDLRPGRWTVATIEAVLPPFHRFAQDSIVLELAPASRETVTFLAQPVERRLHIIAMGNLIEQANTAPTPSARDTRPILAAVPDEPDTGVRTPLPPPSPARRPASSRPAAGPALPPGWSTFVATGSATTLMEVARRHYYETYLWPKIWLANRNSVLDPDNLPDGLILKIPPKAPLTSAEERLWREYDARRWDCC